MVRILSWEAKIWASDGFEAIFQVKREADRRTIILPVLANADSTPEGPSTHISDTAQRCPNYPHRKHVKAKVYHWYGPQRRYTQKDPTFVSRPKIRGIPETMVCRMIMVL